MSPRPAAITSVSSITCFELRRHLGNRHAPDLHRAVGGLPGHDVDLAEFRRLVGIVLAEVPAPALLALDRRARDRLRDGQEMAEVERRVPAGVVLAIAADAHALPPLAQPAQRLDGMLHLRLGPDDADEVTASCPAARSGA